MKKERLEERFGIKVLITILCLTVVQLGNIIPIPTINTAYFSYLVSKTSVLGMMNRFSGGAFQNMTLCALGISIYISASIVIQMLTVIFRKLEELERNGAYGKKQLERITVSFSIFLSVVGAFSFGIMLRANGILKDQKWTTYLITVGCLCFGSLLLILLGKVIDKKGIGNGITVVLMMNMITYIPNDVQSLYYGFMKKHPAWMWVATIAVVIILIILAIFMNEIEKRIKLQYSSAPVESDSVRESSYLSISGRLISVMPAILTSTVFQMITLFSAFGGSNIKWVQYFNMSNWFMKKHPEYMIGFAVYLILMIAFSYFYISITFNPYQMAFNLKKEGVVIENVRPGEETIKYLKKSVNQIVWICIGLLFVLITVPMAITGLSNVSSLNSGGTTLIIIVGAMLETVRSFKGERLIVNYRKKSWLRKEKKHVSSKRKKSC